MTEPMYISNEEALEAVRAAAWTEPAKPEAAICGHRGCEDHPGEGRKMIHVLSGFGMDLPLESAEEFIRDAQRCALLGRPRAVPRWHAEEFIRDAQRCAWVPSLFRHELGAICADGRARYFEVRRPEVVAPAELVGADPAGSPHEGDQGRGGGQ